MGWRTALSNHVLEVLVPGLLALVLGVITLERKAWWFDEAHDVMLARLHWLRLIGGVLPVIAPRGASP